MITDEIRAAARRLAEEPLRRGLVPQALHEYQDREGNAVFYLIRLVHEETGEKWIRPMRLNGAGYELGKPDFPDGSPLYALPDILANPHAVVWVVEGERPADQLNKRLKRLGEYGRHIATTSGGATSASGADWRPLSNHDVRIWPDNDGPGLAYGRDVHIRLQGVGCQAQQLAIENLGLPDHGDVVDWLWANPDASIDVLARLPSEHVENAPAPAEGDSPSGPPQISEEAFYGILRDFVDVACANSEASPVAVAANAIAWFCAAVGLAPYHWIGDGRAHCRPYLLIVGKSAKSRKGTAEKLVRRVFKRVDEILADRIPEYTPLTVHAGGLSSGEGIAHAIRDASDTKDQEGNPRDPGVPDKRLLVIEPEFSNVLANCRRDTSTLSPVIRNCWDGHDLAPLTKNNRTRASNPHVVMIGHITGYELVDRMRRLEMSNGLLNRFLVLHAQRDKLVAHPEPTSAEQVERLAEGMAAAIEFATGGLIGRFDTLRVEMSEDARTRWSQLYPHISCDTPGITGDLTARAELYARMLAMVFALMNRQSVIELPHLLAAIHWMDYVRDSISYIFGAADENKKRDELEAIAHRVAQVIEQRGSASKTDLIDAFGRHKSSAEIDEALCYLMNATPSPIESFTEKTPGRSRTVYRPRASEAREASEARKGHAVYSPPGNSRSRSGDARDTAVQAGTVPSGAALPGGAEAASPADTDDAIGRSAPSVSSLSSPSSRAAKGD